MKRVYFIEFLGTGIRDVRYKAEHGLIQLGRVGLAFEGDPALILGFHPTPEAIEAIGGQEAALTWLRNRKDGNRLDGCLQNDVAIFERAYEISRSNPQTSVWELAQAVDDEVFEQIREQALAWYCQHRVKVSPNHRDRMGSSAILVKEFTLPEHGCEAGRNGLVRTSAAL